MKKRKRWHDMFDVDVFKEALDERRGRKRSTLLAHRHRESKRRTIEDFSHEPEKREVLEAIRSVVSRSPEVREERVAEIRRQLESGTFRVDTTRLAETMLQQSFLEELLLSSLEK